MRLVRSVGGWPRPLNEAAKLLLEQPQTADMAQLYEALRGVMQTRYSAWGHQSSTETVEILLSSLANIPLRNPRAWDARASAGLVVLSGRFSDTPYLPALPALVMLQTLELNEIFCHEVLFDMLRSELLASIKWASWETFVCRAIALRLSAYIVGIYLCGLLLLFSSRMSSSSFLF